MLKGDLATTPLAPLLLDLAEDSSTGCLVIVDDSGDGDEAQLYLKQGLVYAVQVPGRRPQLGSKLVSSGALAPEALADALEAQRTELQGWRLGELLVHLGYVEQSVVEAFVREQVDDAMWDLMRWHNGRWRFRKNTKTREDVAPPMEVVALLSKLRERGYEWQTISAVVHGPGAVPVLSTRGNADAEMTLDPDAWSMLCKIDGERSVADLARDCGYTLFEAGHVIVSLVHAGLVDIEEDVDVAGGAAYGASTLSAAWRDNAESAETGRGWSESHGNGQGELAASNDAEGDALSRLARLVTEVAGGPAATEAAEANPLATQRSLDGPDWHTMSETDDSFAVALARVSSALTEVLGPADGETDPFDVPGSLRVRRRSSEPDPEWDRRAKLRSAAAAELAAAHALAEALRPQDQGDQELPEAEGDIIHLAPSEAERAAQAAAEDAERLEAEAEAERLEAEAEAERLEAEAEAARLEAEAEAARLEAEAEAEAARLEAEAEAEAARLEAEAEASRLAAEEQARLDAEAAARLAAEEEATRLAAEEEATRLAAEEQAQLEAEAEAARLAAEEEAARLAAEEEAARLAAEEQAQLEAEAEAARLAAEEEAARLAAEEEAARLAAEEQAQLEAEAEAARLAAEEEAARLAAEEEATRLAAEEDAARLAADEQAQLEAEAEAARLEAEAEAEAARLAAEEAARLEAEAAQLAADEQARLDAEAEAARLEAEAEAARLAAEEQAQLEAEADAARAAADEQARVEAEAEAARLATEAQEEAARLASDEEAARLAVEEAEARLAAEEQARLVAEAEAAQLAAEADTARTVEEDEARQLAEREFAQLAADDTPYVEAPAAGLSTTEEEAARLADEAQIAQLAEIALQGESDFNAAQAAALLVELSAEPVTGYMPQSSSNSDSLASDDDDEDDDDIYPRQQGGENQADTAALLRELSSLGTEESNGDAPGPPTPPRPQQQRPNAANDKKQRKKIGLFGL